MKELEFLPSVQRHANAGADDSNEFTAAGGVLS